MDASNMTSANCAPPERLAFCWCRRRGGGATASWGGAIARGEDERCGPDEDHCVPNPPLLLLRRWWWCCWSI